MKPVSLPCAIGQCRHFIFWLSILWLKRQPIITPMVSVKDDPVQMLFHGYTTCSVEKTLLVSFLRETLRDVSTT